MSPQVAMAEEVWHGGARRIGDRRGPGRLAGAVSRGDGPQDAAAVGALVPARPARPRRPQEPPAARDAAWAGWPRPAPALHRQHGLERRALAAGPGREGGRARWRAWGGAGDRRHRPAEEGQALGRRGQAILWPTG